MAPAIQAPGSVSFLELPYDVRLIVYGLCLVSADEISLNRMSGTKSRTAPNPLVPYQNLIGAPIVFTNGSRFIPHGIGILKTCKTTYVEGMLILYSENKFLLTVENNPFWKGDKATAQNLIQEAETIRTGGPYTAWLPYLRSLRIYVRQVSMMGECGLWKAVLRQCVGLRLKSITLTPGD